MTFTFTLVQSDYTLLDETLSVQQSFLDDNAVHDKARRILSLRLLLKKQIDNQPEGKFLRKPTRPKKTPME